MPNKRPPLIKFSIFFPIMKRITVKFHIAACQDNSIRYQGQRLQTKWGWSSQGILSSRVLKFWYWIPKAAPSLNNREISKDFDAILFYGMVCTKTSVLLMFSKLCCFLNELTLIATSVSDFYLHEFSLIQLLPVLNILGICLSTSSFFVFREGCSSKSLITGFSASR